VCGASSQRSIIIWLSKSTQQNSCQQHRKFPNNLCRNDDTHSEPLYMSKIPPEFSQPTRSPSCNISTDHASDTRAFRTVPARWQFRPRISPAWLRQTLHLTQAPARSRCARPAHACPLLSRATAPAPLIHRLLSTSSTQTSFFLGSSSNKLIIRGAGKGARQLVVRYQQVARPAGADWVGAVATASSNISHLTGTKR
jgi:hypothetical protein